MDEPCVKKKRWSSEAESYFLYLWSKKQPALRSERKNSHIFREMAAAMQAAGHSCTDQTVRCKIYNMSKKYLEVKNACEIRGSAATWPLYETMHKIIGANASNNIKDCEFIKIEMPTSVESWDTSLEEPPISPLPMHDTALSSPPSPSSSPTSLRIKTPSTKMEKIMEEISKTFKESVENDKKFSEKLLAMEDLRLKEFRKITNAALKASEAICTYLQKQ